MRTSPSNRPTPEADRDVKIPAPARHLATEVLHNASELEVALLTREAPERSWDPASVQGSLLIASGQATESLERLAGIGLLRRTGAGQYRYGPRTSELSDGLDGLARFYRSHRYAVLQLLFSRCKGRVSYFPDS